MNVRLGVSVIIPHYERSELLQQTVESVLRSSNRDFEIIVVDDGSSASEWDRIQRLSGNKVRIIQRKDGVKGPSRCRNIGLRESRGDFAIFLDSDDLMAPWCIADRLAASEANREADGWIFPILLFRNKAGDERTLWNSMSNGTDDRLRFLRSDPPWQTASPMWRKSVIQSLGPFDEDLIYGDDSDFHLRALLSGINVRQFPDSVPDIFIRRSSAPRITNTLSPGLVEARRNRLAAGTRFLGHDPRFATYVDEWEGQYFVEGEFLLFNAKDPDADVNKVLDAWEKAFAPSATRRQLVRWYFRFALACRNKAYLMLRVARRIALRVLPQTYFPKGGDFHSAIASGIVMNEIENHMKRYSGLP